jgi:hypothetical protein
MVKRNHIAIISNELIFKKGRKMVQTSELESQNTAKRNVTSRRPILHSRIGGNNSEPNESRLILRDNGTRPLPKGLRSNCRLVYLNLEQQPGSERILTCTTAWTTRMVIVANDKQDYSRSVGTQSGHGLDEQTGCRSR